MGAILAATTHAPLTSILLIFEMTLDYEVVLPLMLACVTAHYVARIYRARRVGVYALTRGAVDRATMTEWRLRQITALMRPARGLLCSARALASALGQLPRAGPWRAYVWMREQQLVGAARARAPSRKLRARARSGRQIRWRRHAAAGGHADRGDAARGRARRVHRPPLQALPVVSGHWSPVLLGRCRGTICCWPCRIAWRNGRSHPARAEGGSGGSGTR